MEYAMDTKPDDLDLPIIEDDENWADKRGRQQRDRTDLRAGIRTPESMLLFSAEVMRQVNITHRSVEY
jgi:hypothetical protein